MLVRKGNTLRGACAAVWVFVTDESRADRERRGYLEGAVHQSLVEVDHHAYLALVLRRHLGQQAGSGDLRTGGEEAIITHLPPRSLGRQVGQHAS